MKNENLTYNQFRKKYAELYERKTGEKALQKTIGEDWKKYKEGNFSWAELQQITLSDSEKTKKLLREEYSKLFVFRAEKKKNPKDSEVQKRLKEQYKVVKELYNKKHGVK